MEGATRPLDKVLSDYNVAITPRPISLVAQRNGGKKRTRSNAASGLKRLALQVSNAHSNIVFNPASQDFITRAAVLVPTWLRRIMFYEIWSLSISVLFYQNKCNIIVGLFN